MNLSMRPPTFTLLMATFILFFIGCVPDSATKWKEDAPQVEAAAETPEEADAPSTFNYASNEYNLKVGSTVAEQFSTEVEQDELRPTIVNSSRAPTSFAISPVSCQDSLKLIDVYFNTSTGGFYGTPSAGMAPCTFSVIATIPATAGGGGGSETFSNLTFGSYPELKTLGYSQSTRLILTLTGFVGSFTISDILVGDSISTAKTTDDGDAATVEYVDTAGNRIFITRSGGNFDVEEGISNDAQGFVVAKASISAVQNVFDADAIISQTLTSDLVVNPESTAHASGTLSYTSLPLPTGVSLSSTTGTLTIDPTQIGSLAPTTLTIYASNKLGDILSNLSLSVISAPTGFSYTREMIITTDSSVSSSFFSGSKISGYYEGESKGTGRVREAITSTQLLVSHQSGEFLADYDLDRIIPYVSSKGRIGSSDPVYSSAKFVVASTTNFDVGDTITSTGSAGIGVVSLTSGTASGTLFVRVTSGLFIQGDTITEDDLSSSTTITTISATQLRLTVAGAAANFTDGEDVIGSLGAATAIIDSRDLTNQYLYISSYGGDKLFIGSGAEGLDDANPYVAAVDTIDTNGVATDRSFVLNRSFDVVLTPTLSTGEDLVYSTDTTLPEGLTMDSTTGIISGAPTTPQDRTDYIITAENAISAVQFRFSLQVRDILSLANITPSADSYILHREGQSMESASCMLTREQINSDSGNDILCRLEAGELDLFESGLKLEMTAGAAMCNFVRFVPFYFNQYEYKASNQTYYEVTYTGTNNATSGCTTDGDSAADDYITRFPTSGIATNCPSAGHVCIDGQNIASDLATTAFTGPFNTTPAADQTNAVKCPAVISNPSCIGDYSAGGGPNCDTGGYRTVTITCAEGDPTNTPGKFSCSTEVVPVVDNDCAGAAISCINGPATTFAADSNRPDLGVIYQADEGTTQEWTFASPQSKGYVTNLYLANYTNASQCIDNDTYSYISGSSISGEVVADNLGGVISITGGWEGYAVDTTGGGTYDNPIADPTNPFRKISSSLSVNPNPYYTLLCLDAAYDVKARIRVQVREWDRNFNPISNIDSLPDVNGTSRIDVTTPLNYSQVDDWDDYTVSGASGFYIQGGAPNCTSAQMPIPITQHYQLPASEL
ncbi:MAG: hypothetical protein HN623_09815 [Bdellovibrionales bacterium]|nr:hypothetical protein [Bdellovibrionales bacterium]